MVLFLSLALNAVLITDLIVREKSRPEPEKASGTGRIGSDRSDSNDRVV